MTMQSELEYKKKLLKLSKLELRIFSLCAVYGIFWVFFVYFDQGSESFEFWFTAGMVSFSLFCCQSLIRDSIEYIILFNNQIEELKDKIDIQNKIEKEIS